MGFSNLKDMVDRAYQQGRNWYTGFRYNPTYASAQALPYDLSQAPGSPYLNYYPGNSMEATLFPAGSGIWHGGNVSPATKHLHKISIQSVGTGVVPARLILCDYLMYYPYIDMTLTLRRNFSNPVSLPRYTDGDGVYGFIANTTVSNTATNQTLTFVDSTGASGKIAYHGFSTAWVPGVIQNSYPGTTTVGRQPFIGTGNPGRGIRQMTYYENGSATYGYNVCVLVRPLADIKIANINAPVEVDFLTMRPSLPRIYDGAHLNFIIIPNGTLQNVPIIGDITIIWG